MNIPIDPEQRPEAEPASRPAGRRDAGWVFRSLMLLALAGTVIGTVAVGGVFWWFSRELPQIITIADYRPPIVTQVIADDGKEGRVIGEFFKNERRYVVPYDKIPEVVVQAFISAEDDQFFSHQGVNLASMLRAAIANFKAGHVVQGGSTITQQVAKSLLLTPERSFTRKFKEIILASRLERALSKQDILYLYLNQIYLGNGAYGVQAAARSYYQKDVAALTVAEAAMIAGMPQAPGKYSPHQNPKRAKERQLYVLRRMFENGFIKQGQMQDAAAEPLRIFFVPDLNKQEGGHYVEHLRRELLEKYGEKQLFEEGLTVRVPLKVEHLRAARAALRGGLREIDKRIGYRGPLKRLKTDADIEAEIEATRRALVERRLGYQLLMPDGRLDPLEPIRHAGLQRDEQLLTTGEDFTAVVTEVDDKARAATVAIGQARVTLPLENMKWARPAPDEKTGRGWSPEPSAPSKVLRRGDVVLVSLEAAGEGRWTARLEQDPEVQGALYSLDVKTGQVLAMEGGYDFNQSQFNRATQALRQAGSSFKPIIYAAALTRGFTPASIIVDAPVVHSDAELGKWKPSNFDEKFHGDTTFRQSLIKSMNVPTLKIVESIRVPFLIEFAKRLGFTSAFNADLSISLGSNAVSVAELTRVYALFPRYGRRVEPIYVRSVQNRDGQVLEEADPRTQAAGYEVPQSVPADPNPRTEVDAVTGEGVAPPVEPRPAVYFPEYPTPEDPNRVMDGRVAYVMTHLMKEVVAFGTGAAAKGLGRPSAGKTGTTNDYLDAWYVGFTPDVVTGVWVGFDNSRPLGPGETGAKAALPIWLEFMQTAVKDYPDGDFAVPAGVAFANIHPATGKLAAPKASNSIREAFVAGTEPTETYDPKAGAAESQSEFFKEDIE